MLDYIIKGGSILVMVGIIAVWAIDAKQQVEARKVPNIERNCLGDMRFPNVDGANQSWAKCPDNA